MAAHRGQDHADREIAPNSSWRDDSRSANKRCPAKAVIGTSATPTARTGPAGDRAKAMNHNEDAKAPNRPAVIDDRHRRMTTFRAARSRTASQPTRVADCIACTTTNVASAANTS